MRMTLQWHDSIMIVDPSHRPCIHLKFPSHDTSVASFSRLLKKRRDVILNTCISRTSHYSCIHLNFSSHETSVTSFNNDCWPLTLFVHPSQLPWPRHISGIIQLRLSTIEEATNEYQSKHMHKPHLTLFIHPSQFSTFMATRL